MNRKQLAVIAGALLAVSAAPAQAATGDWSYCTQSDSSPHAAGSFVNMVQHQPHITPDTTDHSLSEMAVRRDGRYIEIGWSVDHYRYGDYAPRLFVALEGVTDPAAYVPVSNPNGYASGNQVTVGATGNYGIQHYSGSWWFAYNGYWIGYIPDNTVGFSGALVSQVFSEVYNETGDHDQMVGSFSGYYEVGSPVYGGLGNPWSNNGYAITNPVTTGEQCSGGA